MFTLPNFISHVSSTPWLRPGSGRYDKDGWVAEILVT
jgi:hypothetical protein